EARVLGMTSILERMAQDRETFKTPMILTGDLNAEPGTPEIDGIEATGWLKDYTKAIAYTYHEYGNISEYVKIDYIYLSPEFEDVKTVAWEDETDGVYLSDHYPVAATCHLA
ncbi:MAG: hypothetical protein ACRCW2_07425, partial [Cellulosilyticaceae bacterium]